MRLVLLLILAPVIARAETHSVTVMNGTGDTIQAIMMAPAGSPGPGANRMRSQLPPGAVAHITYSTGCQADLRLGFQDGRTEEHAGVDVCHDPTIVAGQAGVAGPAMAPAAHTSSSRPAAAVKPAALTPGRVPPPVVPPWHGRSITKRFGGMN